jgi:hypothetical protein
MMLRTYLAVIALVLPVILGLGLIWLFTTGVIGMATTLACSFALIAFAVTAVVFHGDDDEAEATAVTDSRLRL